MPYIGNTIRAADDYRLIDDISSGFDGSETSFALQVAGSSPVPFPKSPQQVLISVNGVIQEPDPTGSSGFNLVGTNIVFSSAPTNGHAFFGIIYATADYLNAGGNFPAGSLGAPSITFIGDENTGLFRKSGGSVGFVSDATEIANFDSNGITISSGNIIIPDSIIHNGDTNTKIRFPAADTVSIETAGSEALRVDSSGLLGIGTNSPSSIIHATGSNSSTGYQFINTHTTSGFGVFIKGGGTTADRYALRVDDAAGNERFRINANGRLGLGTNSPATPLHAVSADNVLATFESTDADALIEFKDNSTSDTIVIGALGGDDLLIRCDPGDIIFNLGNNSEKARFDSSGRLLIGDSSSDDSTSMLQVKRANNSTIRVASSDATATNFAAIDFAPANSTVGASITCTADATFSGSSNQDSHLKFSTINNGTLAEGLRIDKNSRVGIQGAPTRAVLDVRASGGNSNMLTAVFGANEGQTGGSLSDNADKACRIGSYHYDLDEEPFALITAGGGSSSNSMSLGGGTSLMNATTLIQFYTAANHTTTNGTERMRIDSSGQVLIGTSDGTSIGTINTNLVIGSTTNNEEVALTLNVMESTNNRRVKYFLDDDDGVFGLDSTASTGVAPFVIRMSGTERMRLTTDGKLYVGESSGGDAGAAIAAKNTAADANYTNFTKAAFEARLAHNAGSTNKKVAMLNGWDGNIHGTSIAQIFDNSGYKLSFAVNSDTSDRPEERMLIQRDGRLDLIGEMGGQGSGSLVIFKPNSNNGVQNDAILFDVGGSGRGKIVTASSGTGLPQFGTYSDRRLKTNIADYTGGYEKIKAIKVRTYDEVSNDSTKEIIGETPATGVVGYIADEFQTVFPEGTVGTKDAVVTQADLNAGLYEGKSVGDPIYQSMSEGVMLPHLVQALQAAIAKIEVLETEVATLKAS